MTLLACLMSKSLSVPHGASAIRYLPSGEKATELPPTFTFPPIFRSALPVDKSQSRRLEPNLSMVPVSTVLPSGEKAMALRFLVMFLKVFSSRPVLTSHICKFSSRLRKLAESTYFPSREKPTDSISLFWYLCEPVKVLSVLAVDTSQSLTIS